MTATRGKVAGLPSGGGLSCTLLLNGTLGAALVAALIQTVSAWPNLSLIPSYLMLSVPMAGIGAITGVVASLTSILARRVVLSVTTSRKAEAWAVLLGAFPSAAFAPVVTFELIWSAPSPLWVSGVAGCAVPLILVWALTSHRRKELQ